MKTWMDALNKARSVLTRLDSDNRIHPLLNPVGATTTARMSFGRAEHAELQQE
jgi:hypothetical protein